MKPILENKMKKIIFILMISLLIITPLFAENNFTDVENDKWYSEWIGIINYLNITSGYPDGTFKPNNQLKRIELLSFTMKALGHDIPVAENYWGQNIINKALDENIISKDDSSFTEPEGYITREETARIIYNAYLKNNEIFNSDVDQYIRSTISDIKDINDDHIQGIVGVFASGIVEGYDDGSFKPKNLLTRAEAAVFITRLALPEKRVQVDLNLNKFVYKTSIEGQNDFTVYYGPEHQDIYNVLDIINTITNGDTEDGIAVIYGDGNEGYHNVSFFTSQWDYENAGVYIDNYASWKVDVRRVPPNSENWLEDYIRIANWKSEIDVQHNEVIRVIFNYLFEEESDYVWNKFNEISINYTDEVYDFDDYVKNRHVRIASSDKGINLLVSRVISMNPVDIESIMVK